MKKKRNVSTINHLENFVTLCHRCWTVYVCFTIILMLFCSHTNVWLASSYYIFVYIPMICIDKCHQFFFFLNIISCSLSESLQSLYSFFCYFYVVILLFFVIYKFTMLFLFSYVNMKCSTWKIAFLFILFFSVCLKYTVFELCLVINIIQ